MEPSGVDEFGREHFVVEAAPGRLGISLGEDERGFIIVRGVEAPTADDLEAWDEADQRCARLMRQTVHVGDRLVAIESMEIIHCALKDVISRLAKLASMRRRLTFARYHACGYDPKKYDVEKLVVACLPPGPMGLLINDTIPYGAFIDGFQVLPNGSMSRLARHPKIHRGCQIISVNGTDVSGTSREDVITLLSSIREQDKTIIFYRPVPPRCAGFICVDASASERHLGFTVDESVAAQCVVSVVGPRGSPSIHTGDILIGVNNTDVSWMMRKDAVEFVKESQLPRHLYFARLAEAELPECHLIKIESGPLGLNLDSEQTSCARITGFTSPADAERPAFKSCAAFLPGSFILRVGKLDVAQRDLAAVSGLLVKLKESPKEILLGNAALRSLLIDDSVEVKLSVPSGPLGINFSGNHQHSATVSGFYALPDGSSGAIEQSGRVAIGDTLQRINGMNVSCLRLTQVTDLLRKLAKTPKELVFMKPREAQDSCTRVIEVRVPAGPLGIDLKSSISSRTIVDKLNQDPSRGSTRIFDHGGVIEGSELVAIDGFDVSDLDLPDILQLLRNMAPHEKTITFCTTTAAYEEMINPKTRPYLMELKLEDPRDILLLDPATEDRAVLVNSNHEQAPPSGSRLIAIESVDVRTLSRRQIASILSDLGYAEVALIFDTRGAAPPSPTRSPSLTETVAMMLFGQTSPKRQTVAEALQSSYSPTKLAIDTQVPAVEPPIASASVSPTHQQLSISPAVSPKKSPMGRGPSSLLPIQEVNESTVAEVRTSLEILC
ncbi:hypothetical protein PINS_up020314 [Pythium insidiosum]|nr:hypothetical protein PINS_up020314 [Pythium insidiosum]